MIEFTNMVENVKQNNRCKLYRREQDLLSITTNVKFFNGHFNIFEERLEQRL